MTQTRRTALLILLGVAVLVLAILVLIRSRSWDLDFLAIIGILGGLAIVLVSLPTTDKR
jgi:hypothetical protein